MDIKQDIVRGIYNRIARVAGAEGLGKPAIQTVSEGPLQRVTALFAIRSFEHLQKPHAVKVRDGLAYVTGNASDSVCVFDVSELENMRLVGTLSHSKLEGAHDLSLRGDYAVITCQQGDRVTIIDISDPESISIVASIRDERLSGAKRHHLRDGLLYSSVKRACGLTIVDVTTLKKPEIIGSVSDSELMESATDAYVRGEYAFVSALRGEYSIIDISEPTAPEVTASLHSNTLHKPKNSVVDGRGIAYIAASGSDTISLVDVSDPQCPSEITAVSDERFSVPLDVALNNTADPEYAYVTFRRDENIRTKLFGTSFVILDISSPNEPEVVETMKRNLDMLDPQYITSDIERVYIAADGSYSLNAIL